jgi:hypothetical protein
MVKKNDVYCQIFRVSSNGNLLAGREEKGVLLKDSGFSERIMQEER